MPVEDTATAVFEYGNGCEVKLFFTWAGEERRNTVVLTGENGSISVLDNKIVCESTGGEELYSFSEGLSEGSHHPEWYGMVVRDFVMEMEGKTGFLSNFNEAVSCFSMLDGCRCSAETGKVTVLSPVL
jgi:predicted dehydrogenase